jgi:hypothetical protein
VGAGGGGRTEYRYLFYFKKMTKKKKKKTKTWVGLSAENGRATLLIAHTRIAELARTPAILMKSTPS